MSEADNVWRVDVHGAPHQVELEHDSWSGRRRVLVDGELVHESRKWWDTGSTHEFPIGTATATVKIRMKYSGFAHGSALYLDGQFISPLSR